MLKKITIKNYAIIAELEISFHEQLTVITGETGAGKSIILGALSLLLGERADTSVLINKEEKCIIEGQFDISKLEDAKAYLDREGFDIEEISIVRREINTSGKSRAFINDTPATLQQLQVFGNYLVDLNRQFDNQLLHQQSYQYGIIDTLANNESTLFNFRQVYQSYNIQKNRLEEMKTKAAVGQAEYEYNNYLLEELIAMNFQENEIEELEQKLKQAIHQENIVNTKKEALYNLLESDDNQISKLKSISNSLQQITTFQMSIQPLVDRIEGVIEELKDISYELDDNQYDISFSLSEMEQMQDRLDIGFKLMKKHQVDSTAALIDKQQSLSRQISEYGNIDDVIQSIENELNRLEDLLAKYALDLFENRAAVAEYFERQVKETLSKIGMPNVAIKVVLSKVEKFNIHGKDELSILIDANKSGRFLPISKVASGGEMSRVLLSIKSLISNKLSLGTLIFDEVDSAISGEASKQVALLIKSLSKDQQVIVLTHQAQMAAKGNLHLYIYKSPSNDGQLQTQLQILEGDERILNIAQMIDGDNPSDTTKESVTSMIMN